MKMKYDLFDEQQAIRRWKKNRGNGDIASQLLVWSIVILPLTSIMMIIRESIPYLLAPYIFMIGLFILFSVTSIKRYLEWRKNFVMGLNIEDGKIIWKSLDGIFSVPLESIKSSKVHYYLDKGENKDEESILEKEILNILENKERYLDSDKFRISCWIRGKKKQREMMFNFDQTSSDKIEQIMDDLLYNFKEYMKEERKSNRKKRLSNLEGS